MASILDLMGHVQQQGELGRQRGAESRLARLAGQAYAAPRDQRDSFVQQAVATDPRAGFALQDKLQSNDDDRIGQLSQKARLFVGLAKSGNPQAIQSMYPQLAREASQAFGMQIPEVYDEKMLPHLEQLAALSGGQAPELAPRVVGDALVDSTGRVLYQSQPKQDYQWSDRAGAWIPKPMAGGGQQPAPSGSTVFRTSNGQPFDVSQVTDPTMRAEIMSNPDAYGLLSDAGGGSVELPQRDVTPQQYGGLSAIPVAGIGPKPAAAPAPTELERRVDMARKMGASDDEIRAIVMGNASTQGPSPAEQKDALARKAKQPQIANAVRGVDRISKALEGLSGGLVNTGPLDQYATRYTKAGQELEAAIGGIQNSLLSLTRVPGIGSQSDLEARIANMQYPSLDKDPAVNARTLENLKAFIADLQDAYRLADATPPAGAESPSVMKPIPSGGWSIQRVD